MAAEPRRVTADLYAERQRACCSRLLRRRCEASIEVRRTLWELSDIAGGLCWLCHIQQSCPFGRLLQAWWGLVQRCHRRWGFGKGVGSSRLISKGAALGEI